MSVKVPDISNWKPEPALWAAFYHKNHHEKLFSQFHVRFIHDMDCSIEAWKTIWDLHTLCGKTWEEDLEIDMDAHKQGMGLSFFSLS